MAPTKAQMSIQSDWADFNITSKNVVFNVDTDNITPESARQFFDQRNNGMSWNMGHNQFGHVTIPFTMSGPAGFEIEMETKHGRDKEAPNDKHGVIDLLIGDTSFKDQTVSDRDPNTARHWSFTLPK